MYERLQNHPNPKVSKKARQFMFSFQVIFVRLVDQVSKCYLQKPEML